MAKKCKSCEHLQKELSEVKDELAYLKYEFAQFRSEKFKRKKKKKESEQEQKSPKPKGAKPGHKGWFRKKPEPDKTIIVKAEQCPHCLSKRLTEYKKTEEHIQEDLILPQTEVTLFKKGTYYCNDCKKSFTAKAENELSNSHIGPTAKSLACFLKYSVRTSDANIQQLFDKVFGLKIVPSSISGFRGQLHRKCRSVYDMLVESLKTGNFIHADETGWRVDGEPCWMWKYSNKKVSVSKICVGRGQQEVQQMLGDEYNGTLISDFLSAYSRIASKKQRCLVHLIRDLDKVIKYWDIREDDYTVRYCEELKKLLFDAISLHKEYKNKKWTTRYRTRRKEIIARLEDFSFPDPNKRKVKTFAKRLNRHKEELFTFLFEKNIDYHNNHAEQQIRPDVILRKIINGNRSDKGARMHETIMSVLQTAKLNSIEALDLFTDILCNRNNIKLETVLSPP